MKSYLIFLVAIFGCTRLVGMSDAAFAVQEREAHEISRRLDRVRALEVARKVGAVDIFDHAQQDLNAVREGSAVRGHRSLQVLQQPLAAHLVGVWPAAAAPGTRSLLSWLDNVSWFDLTVVPASLMALFVIAKHALR